MNHPEPNVPFVQAWRVGGRQRKPTAISIKISFTTSEVGAALGIARFHHKPGGPLESYHYILDEEKTFRCIPSDVASYGRPYRAVNILVCAQPHEEVLMWEDATAKPVIQRAAALVAELALAHKIKVRYLTDEERRLWTHRRSRRRGGLIIDVPGAWPYKAFLRDVESQILSKSKGSHNA